MVCDDILVYQLESIWRSLKLNYVATSRHDSDIEHVNRLGMHVYSMMTSR